MSKWDRWPWRKLYIPEEGSFALLPLYVRALAGQLLKMTDDQGRIFIGNREPWEAVAKRGGADRGDRRLLKTHIPTLIKDGYLEVEGEYLIVRNLPIAQASREERVRLEEESRKRSESASNEQRTDATEQRPSNETERQSNDGATNGRDRATTEQRPSNDRATKLDLSAENHSGQIARIEENRREKKEPLNPLPPVEGRSARPDPFADTLTGRSPGQRVDVLELFRAWAQAFGYTGAKPRKPHDERLRVLAECIDTHGAETCRLVLAHAPSDRMVSGKDDEKGRKHDTIDYIFGNENTFQRILKAANEAKARSSGGSIREALQAARAAGGAP